MASARHVNPLPFRAEPYFALMPAYARMLSIAVPVRPSVGDFLKCVLKDV